MTAAWTDDWTQGLDWQDQAFCSAIVLALAERTVTLIDGDVSSALVGTPTRPSWGTSLNSTNPPDQDGVYVAVGHDIQAAAFWWKLQIDVGRYLIYFNDKDWPWTGGQAPPFYTFATLRTKLGLNATHWRRMRPREIDSPAATEDINGNAVAENQVAYMIRVIDSPTSVVDRAGNPVAAKQKAQVASDDFWTYTRDDANANWIAGGNDADHLGTYRFTDNAWELIDFEPADVLDSEGAAPNKLRAATSDAAGGETVGPLGQMRAGDYIQLHIFNELRAMINEMDTRWYDGRWQAPGAAAPPGELVLSLTRPFYAGPEAANPTGIGADASESSQIGQGTSEADMLANLTTWGPSPVFSPFNAGLCFYSFSSSNQPIWTLASVFINVTMGGHYGLSPYSFDGRPYIVQSAVRDGYLAIASYLMYPRTVREYIYPHLYTSSPPQDADDESSIKVEYSDFGLGFTRNHWQLVATHDVSAGNADVYDGEFWSSPTRVLDHTSPPPLPAYPGSMTTKAFQGSPGALITYQFPHRADS